MSESNLPLWITEDITWPVLWLMLLLGALIVTWLVSGQFRFFGGALAIAGLLAALIVIEMNVETDREYLVNTVYEMAGHVENNNVDGILKFVRPENTGLVNRIRANMKRYDFDGCRLIGFNNSQMRVDTEQGTALIPFSVLGSGSPASMPGQPMQGAVAVNLEFSKTNGRWTIEGYGYKPSNSTQQISMIRD